MSKNIRDYEFRSDPKEITYFDDEPLKLTKEFNFFHNKSKFRKEITRLQLNFKDYTGVSLPATAIRDSYLAEDLSNKFYLIVFTTSNIIKDSNQIISPYKDTNIKPGCYYLESTSQYMLLLAHDMEGLKAGLDTLEEVINQAFKEHSEQRDVEEYIKIKPFKLLNCVN
ncbi:MAG: hypothetical protein ACFFE5_15595 [Candidatus Thorarchaeota archaeon]